MIRGDLRAVLALSLAAIAAPATGQETAAAEVAAASPVMAAAPAPGIIPPAERDLRAALAAAGLGPEALAAAEAFYAAREFAPFWSAGDGAAGAALAAALADAGAHGLSPARYDPAALGAALAGASDDPALAPAAEAAATRVYLAYARDLSSGMLTPARVDPEIRTEPRRPAPAAMLARLDGASVADALAALAPAGPEYLALMDEKARLEAAAATDWGPDAPAGPTLRLGDAGPRVAALRARLAARGHDATPEAGADPARFDAGLEAALKGFQAGMGLEADGLAGARSIAALNEAPDAALKQVVVNLERARWTNGALEGRYLWANIPDYSVRLVEDGRTVLASRTVVGQAADTRTPEFSDVMTYFVVNPTWHIPDSIAQRVYLPKLKANPNTLANSNMRIFTRAGTEINPGLVDFNQFSSGNFPFRIKQNPSQANALGRVKFMFPNQYAIYLHDTPVRELFDRAERAFSNGCVRVEDPLELAHLLLAGQEADPAAAFDGWLSAKAERYVTLERPVPVHLVYRTVFLDPDTGALTRRFDVYGRDKAVWEALAAAGVTLPAAQG